MTDYKKRLKKEAKELLDKVIKLQTFMVTRDFYRLRYEHQTLLEKQLIAMREYLEILSERCDLFRIDILSEDE